MSLNQEIINAIEQWQEQLFNQSNDPLNPSRLWKKSKRSSRSLISSPTFNCTRYAQSLSSASSGKRRPGRTCFHFAHPDFTLMIRETVRYDKWKVERTNSEESMKIKVTFRRALLIAICCAMAIAIATGQTKPQKSPATTERVQPGQPKIWRDPGRVEQLDFQHGPGGIANAPKSPFTFIEEDLDGSNPKIKVRDAAGREWGVKWGSEVNAEVFASRIAWAAGYFVEPSYFVASGKVSRVAGLTRAKKQIAADGSFTDARFELKLKGIKKAKDELSWQWIQNPFVGTKELNGLKVVMMLVSNWDSKDQRDARRGSNTAIFKNKEGEDWHVVTDWGGTMGKWGGVLSREKWDCKGYTDQNQKFITRATSGLVQFGYSGQHTDSIRDNIRASDVGWLMTYLGRITDAQLRAGLKASGATADEVECFTLAIRQRLELLKANSR